jgi:hypothetical protein
MAEFDVFIVCQDRINAAVRAAYCLTELIWQPLIYATGINGTGWKYFKTTKTACLFSVLYQM